jgi:Flp pilus assembly protein TadD
VFVPLVAACVIESSAERGLARVRALLEEPPARSERGHALAWDFLASRYHDLRGPAAEAAAFRRSADYAPNPRVLHSWGQAAERAGNRAEALEAYRRLAARDSLSVEAWMAVGRLSMDTGDTESAWRAAVRLRALAPDDPNVRRVYAVMDSLRKASGR